MNHFIRVLIVLLMAFVPACNDDDDSRWEGAEPGGGVKEKFLPANLAARKRVIGSWELAPIEVDDAKARKKFAAQGVPASRIDARLESFKKSMSSFRTTITFGDDGTLSGLATVPGTVSQQQVIRGKWHVSSTDGDVVIIKLQRDNGRKDEKMSIKFKNDAEFEMMHNKKNEIFSILKPRIFKKKK